MLLEYRQRRATMSNDKDKLELYKAALEHTRYEGSLLWQIFGAFLLVHTIFMAFIFQAIEFEGERQWGIIIAGVAGLLMCIPWSASYFRSSKYYELRMAQARQAEPEDWNLIREVGKDFSDGARVEIEGKLYQNRLLGKVIKTKYSVGAIILIFLALYFSIVLIGFGLIF